MGLKRLTQQLQDLPCNPRTRFLDLLHQGVRVVHEQEESRKHEFFHASSIGYCLRATYFKETSLKDDPKFLKKVDYGHAAHALYQKYLAHTGQLFGNWYCPLCGDVVGPCFKETPLHKCDKTGLEIARKYSELVLINNKLGISGHPDGFLRLREKSVNLIEIKTITPFYRIGEPSKEFPNPKDKVQNKVPEHIRQTNLYTGLIMEDSTIFENDAKDILLALFDPSFYLLVYLDKGTDDTIPYEFAYDPELYAEDKERVAYYRSCKKKKEVPKAEPGMGGCRWCDFINHCNGM